MGSQKHCSFFLAHAALPFTLLPLLALPSSAQVQAAFQPTASAFAGSLPATAAVTMNGSAQNTFVFAATPLVLTADDSRSTQAIFDFVIPASTAAGRDGAFSTADLAETPATLPVTVQNAPFSEASTTVSFGLLLLLGSAALVVRRKKTTL